ncbi:two-component system sensor histidine kinase NtrB [Maridesulfovibrio hydrothermalis]|uniref:histidine kinase n=1 Tax=Maridesulfovibrio hydrothermalis AM13 = DSM 14728 TaxID=1121451 RepID=L0R8G7_9BACT|nr:ATP-binding protein [Maridesulfovibrio hydrothermalis]CCO22512.1 PAS/PAC sensor signal transduction histidine kinase [Maridesulfovibrio hydrothermalis AM13 = DSM 14728]
MELSSKKSNKLPLALALLALVLLGAGSLYLTWHNLRQMHQTVFEHMLLSARSISRGLDIQLVEGARRMRGPGMQGRNTRRMPANLVPEARELFKEMVAQGDLLFIALYGPDRKPLLVVEQGKEINKFSPPLRMFDIIRNMRESSTPVVINGQAALLYGTIGQPALLKIYGNTKHRFLPPQERETYLLLALNAEKHLHQFKQYRRAALLQTGYIFLAGLVLWLLAVAYFQRREQGKKLGRLERFQANLLDNMPDGLLTLSPDGTILAANGSAHKLLDTSADKALAGMNWNNFSYESLQEFKRGNVIWIHAKLSGKNLEFIIFPYFESKDEERTMIIIRDRTDISGLEEDLYEARRLASIGSLAAGVAHEIRNPLSSLRGFAQLFAEKFKDEQPYGTYATTMLEEADRLNRVVTDLLYLSKPHELDPVTLELSDLLESMQTLMGFDLEHKGAVIETELKTTQVYADSDGIRQVLLNLLVNSLDAIPEQGGKISITAESDEHGVWISICDNGPGMPDDIRKHALEPFFTDKPKGTGLGLAIVNTIMRGHNGRVSISDPAATDPLNGTCVKLFFPNPRSEG